MLFVVRHLPKMLEISPFQKALFGPVPGVVYPAIGQNKISLSDRGFQVVGGGNVTRKYPDETGPGCGDFMTLHACPNEPAHFVHRRRASCRNRGCPKCYPSFVTREADSISARVRGCGGLRGVHGVGTRLSHVVISPPIDNYDWKNEFDRAKRDLKEVRDRSGLTGGAAIFHPLRRTERAKLEFQGAKWAGYPGSGWDWVHENGYINDPDYVYFSPHWHIIGYGWIEPGDTEFALTGWVVKRIRTITGIEGGGVKRLLHYLLTHAGWKDNGARGGNCVIFFGEMSVRSMGVTSRKETHLYGCPVCGCRVEEFIGPHVCDELPTGHDPGRQLRLTDISGEQVKPLFVNSYRTCQPYRVPVVDRSYWFRDNPGTRVTIKGEMPPPVTWVKAVSGGVRTLHSPCISPVKERPARADIEPFGPDWLNPGRYGIWG